MEGGGGSSMMSFGENSDGLCPSMMMPPLSSHPNSHAPSSSMLFLPLPLPSNNQDLNRYNSGGGGSTMMIEENYNNASTGDYLMESNSDNDGGNYAVKAKIMAHPHYHRLLAAYVNCQKVKKNDRNFSSEIVKNTPRLISLSLGPTRNLKELNYTSSSCPRNSSHYFKNLGGDVKIFAAWVCREGEIPFFSFKKKKCNLPQEL